MSNGDVAAEKGGKMKSISAKLKYLEEACTKNIQLSSEIRAKLLATDPKEVCDEAEKMPKEGGQLNNIRDSIQDLLNLINSSNSHLVSVNKEI